MNEAPRRRGGAMRLVAPLAAALLIVLLAAITISGHWPELKQMVHFAAKGLVASAPSDITQVEIRAGQESVALSPRDRRLDDRRHDRRRCRPSLLRISTSACGFCMSASRRARSRAAELTPASFAEFGLDPPASVVALGTANGRGGDHQFRRAQSGRHLAICPASADRPTVYLMPRHVGSEWQVAGDMARRLARRRPSRRSRTADRACSCRCRWRRYGRSRSCPPASSPASSAIAPATGSGTPDSIRTRPTPMPTSPIRRRPASSRAALECVRCDRGRDACRPRRRCRSAGAIRPLIPAGDRACSMRATTRRSWRASNSAVPPTASIAMRGLRRTARS